MDREKGMAYCGLACCLCTFQPGCRGCKEQGCPGEAWCKIRSCCQDKGLRSCGDCPSFPCDAPLFAKVKVRTFAKMVSEVGEEKMMDLLQKAEERDVIYHYEGKIVGDYDMLKDEQEVRKLVLG
ncbi:MAG: DUF3795 domain-containing protein [Sphaerochaetaceae bacterium]